MKSFYLTSEVLNKESLIKQKISSQSAKRRRENCYQSIIYPCLEKSNTKLFKPESSFAKVKCHFLFSESSLSFTPRTKLSAEEAVCRKTQEIILD